MRACDKKYIKPLKFIQRNKKKAMEMTESHNGIYKRVKEVWELIYSSWKFPLLKKDFGIEV